MKLITESRVLHVNIQHFHLGDRITNIGSIPGMPGVVVEASSIKKCIRELYISHDVMIMYYARNILCGFSGNIFDNGNI